MLESFKAQPSPALTRPTHHAAALATASQAQLPAPPGDERTQEQLHDALQIANKRALNSCSSRCDATGSRSLSALPPGALAAQWVLQPHGTRAPSAAFWAERIDSVAAGDAVHTAPQWTDLQPSCELTSTMAANAADDSESLS